MNGGGLYFVELSDCHAGRIPLLLFKFFRLLLLGARSGCQASPARTLVDLPDVGLRM